MKPFARRAPPIKQSTALQVYAAAGGRCSFYGCTDSVMVEALTSKRANLGNIAHIAAESEDGPRGDDPLPIEKRAEFENLMLMCTKHHNLIDKKEHVPQYPAELLRWHKRHHEDHIRHVTSLPTTSRTCAVRLAGQIRGHMVRISDAEVMSAVFAHERCYVDTVVDVDLGGLPDSANGAYLSVATQKIDAALHQRILPLVESGEIQRVSIFALARIPLLCHFGHQLGDKVPASFYQKHRGGGEGWAWPTEGGAVEFEVVEHRNAASPDIGLLVSVSGGDVDKVRRSTNAGLIYEIRPVGVQPSRMLLSSPATLDNFRRTYHDVLGRIEVERRTVAGVDYFLAAPAPIAMICGRDLLRDVVPRVVVHDLVDAEYQPALILGAAPAALRHAGIA